MEKLGKKATDKITGFKGVITGKCDYLYGCTQYGVTPPMNRDGEIGGTEWFDEGRIEVIEDAIKPATVRGRKPGGPNRDAPR